MNTVVPANETVIAFGRFGESQGDRMQNNHYGAVRDDHADAWIAAQIGCYLEPSLCMPHLTRTSAAWTCSLTVFT